ncbi:unnamed protein product [Cuscuta campestris]|uniref:MAPK kinase substrate protein n=1 Tax=Cuscuta campestris TaxID=132261 RepID=A0A484KJ55_9ASTE|nr:unnamed protein product [Cuscuta campestris]
MMILDRGGDPFFLSLKTSTLLRQRSALPRSEISFRRQGSSGLVWDDKLLSGDPKAETSANPAGGGYLRRSRSSGSRGFRSSADLKPSCDPPSPKVSGCCICCGVFGRKPGDPKMPRKSANRHV